MKKNNLFIGWSSPSRIHYTPPPIQDGGKLSIRGRESREELLIKFLVELDTKNSFRQNYSNGEFICSSLIIGKTFKSVCDEKLELDGAHSVAYFDEELSLWWREGGYFD